MKFRLTKATIFQEDLYKKQKYPPLCLDSKKLEE